MLCTLASCDVRKDSAPPSRAGEPIRAADIRLPATLPATDDPFYILWQTYAPYTAVGDPLGFPMKARNLSTSAYRFWRGAKEPFYLWCKTHTADWLADDAAFLRIHGDLHPGNMGIYPTAANGAQGPSLAFGAVDFDDAARLPFQLELLEGTITFQLLARHREIKLDPARVDQVIATMLQTYRAALTSDRTATQLLEADAGVARLFKQVRKRPYADELDKYVRNDRLEKSNGAKELLQRIPERAGFPEALAEALTRTADAQQLFKDAPVIKDVARRTHLESAGSEGLGKYLVLVATAPTPVFPDGRAILYLKQQIPSPAERVGLIAPRPAQDIKDLSIPAPLFNSRCTWNGQSYRVTLKEPWSETLDSASIDNFEDLLHAARIWGTLAGCLHRQGQPTVEQILARLTPDLPRQLRDLGTTYAAKAIEDHRRFDRDPRTRALSKQAEAALKEAE
jgi:hypothetical protein